MKLTTKARNALPKADFALPGKRAFPIENAAHGRAALSRVADKPAKEKAEVKSKVKAAFPEMLIGSGKNAPHDNARSEPKAKPFGGKGKGEHTAPTSHAEFSSLGHPKDGKY